MNRIDRQTLNANPSAISAFVNSVIQSSSGLVKIAQVNSKGFIRNCWRGVLEVQIRVGRRFSAGKAVPNLNTDHARFNCFANRDFSSTTNIRGLDLASSE